MRLVQKIEPFASGFPGLPWHFWTGLIIAGAGALGAPIVWYLGEQELKRLGRDCATCDAAMQEDKIRASNVRAYDRATNYLLATVGVGTGLSIVSFLYWALATTDASEDPTIGVQVIPSTTQVRIVDRY